jgi:hypothetical protein
MSDVQETIAFFPGLRPSLVLIYAWWGGFNPVQISEAVRGPYIYAYLEVTGDYAKLPDRQGEVKQALRAQHIEPGLPVNVLFSNPDLVTREARQAHTGYLVPADSVVKPPLKIASVSARRVIVAEVRAGQLLAPSRAYAALDRHQQAQGRGIVMPTLELYRPSSSTLTMGEFSVEMEVR